jgi:hypothetical protein
MYDPGSTRAHFGWGGLLIDPPIHGAHGIRDRSRIGTAIKATKVEEQGFSRRLSRRRLRRILRKYVAEHQTAYIVGNALSEGGGRDSYQEQACGYLADRHYTSKSVFCRSAANPTGAEGATRTGLADATARRIAFVPKAPRQFSYNTAKSYISTWARLASRTRDLRPLPHHLPGAAICSLSRALIYAMVVRADG